MSIGSMSHFIEASKVLIDNASGVPELAATLSVFGYDAARLAEGAKLWADAESFVRKQAKEYGEQYQASAEADAARADFEAVYMKALKVARVAFSEDALAAGSLKLYGPRKQSTSGFIDQAATFYANISADTKLISKMSRFGYTEAKLKGEAAMLATLRAKLQARAKETGEAQAATAGRDAKLRELDSWVSDLRAICKVAFYDSKPELEKLGFASQGSLKRKKTEPAPAAK